jgi:integrase
MPLEIRRDRHENIIPHWFGRYTTADGRRILVRLKAPFKGVPPADGLINTPGDDDFEAGKETAMQELRQAQENSKSGRMEKSAALSVYRQKTGMKLKEVPISKLPEIVTAATKAGGRGESWGKWKLQAVNRFVVWCTTAKVRNVLDVNKEVALSYLNSLYAPDKEAKEQKAPKEQKEKKEKSQTASTVRRVKYTLGMVFDRALPEGAPNPFRAKDVMIASVDGDKQFNRVPLSAREVERLLEVAKDDQMMYDLIVCALSTGLRKGDICNLRWSGVDLSANSLKITTSKTQTDLYLPILPLLRTVLERRLTARGKRSLYVFPEAHQMAHDNTSGITWRIKKLFATAFAPTVEADAIAKDAKRLEALPDRIPEVVETIKGASMLSSKKEKVIDLLNRYLQGQNYPKMQQETGIAKGAISELLHEAQEISEINFLPEKRKNVKEMVSYVTRVKRELGSRAASKYDFHALRTTFVTLALSAGIGVEILKALTGHATVEIVMRHYFKPKGSDFAVQLTKAMPAVLTATSNAPKHIAGKRKTGEVIPEKVSEALRFIETLELTKEERESLRGLI